MVDPAIKMQGIKPADLIRLGSAADLASARIRSDPPGIPDSGGSAERSA